MTKVVALILTLKQQMLWLSLRSHCNVT